MGEELGGAASKPKPTILVPPRGSMESLFTNGLAGIGISPGPITLMSNFFSDQGPFTFSQLLAGAMVSPMAPNPNFLFTNQDEKDTSSETNQGYKRNRPLNLVVAPPQHETPFMVTPGFSPSALLNSPGFLSPLQSPFGMSHQQALAHVTAQAALSQSYKQMHAENQFSSSTATSESFLNYSSPSPTETTTQQTQTMRTEPESLKVESPEVCQSDKKAANFAVEKPASDGYNWRKYGQKQVKASECPRSYYKCTHLNCPVKKKVERSFDGHVSGIVYKGHHNHDPPQSNKRGKVGSASDKGQIETNKLNEGPDAANFQETNQQTIGHHPVASHNHAMEDNVIAVDCGDDDDEPVSKRRSIDNVQSVPSSSHQTTITESKIVVQTRSEVDLLDDGYKWRKYGQKVVKGNAHPRSYYRCTYAGCNVRKHVERASADPKSVITTYEGKHDHELPIGRYSNHAASNANAQQLKTQKIAAKPSRETNFGNKDMVPITLHLKEEQIAA